MDNIELMVVFSSAIKREVESYEFYKGVSESVKDDSVKDIFSTLAKEEMSHMEILEKLKADPTASIKFAAPATDFKVAEATELPELTLDMKPKDAIVLAMKKEEEAVEFYRCISKVTDDAGIKEIFENLANMELGHKQRLENVFVEIGYPEVF